MKIKFRTVSASAMGVFHVGDVAELDDKFAKPLIDGGFAVCLDAPPAEVKAEEKPAPKRKGKKVE